MEEGRRARRSLSHVTRNATGEVEEGQEPEDPAAVLGRKGAAARARNLSPERLREIAKKAAAKRWDPSQPGHH